MIVIQFNKLIKASSLASRAIVNESLSLHFRGLNCLIIKESLPKCYYSSLRSSVTRVTKPLIVNRFVWTPRSTPKIINHLAYTPRIRVNSTQYLRGTKPQETDHVITRGYPGKGYTAADHTKTIVGIKPDGKPLLESNVRNSLGEKTPQHESSHTNIIDNATGLGVGITTSAKKTGFISISTENFKNQVVTKNGPSKHQQIGLFDQPKSFEEGSIVKNEQATAFLEKHELLLDEILTKHPVSSTFNIPQRRLHKDSSTLYHENGQPIYDNNGNEIEY
jgi:hypothetical protein